MKAKWLTGILSGVLAVGLIQPAAFAEEEQTIEDEIIYDVLIDRFFNKQIENDFEVDAQNPAAFNGGDFGGVIEQLQHVKDMGFTLLSIGSVFATDTYDGKKVLDYRQLERHFGTEEELKEVVEKTHEFDLKLMVDVPTQQVSSNHIWAAENPQWFSENEDGTLALDTSNPEVQDELIAAMSEFIDTYQVDGLRLSDADQLDPQFIEKFSEAIKEIRDVYLINDVEMEATPGFDAMLLPGAEETLRTSYKNFGADSTGLGELVESSEGQLIQIDSLLGSRFVSDVVAERGFPPTRMRVIFSQLLTMPGIPVVQYGSETAMNGVTPQESHQILDLSVDEELIEHISDLNSLRNSSEALRTGDTEIILEEPNWLVYKRSNDEETWIVAINNSAETKAINLPADVIGSDKELRGLFESDIIRQEANGEYRITLDREIGETFHVIDETGFNKAYLAALAVLYLVFMAFLWVVWRKGKQRKANRNAAK
ncbi:alpha-amylase family glycosyl hydrolase [Planococcus sp. NCCP-2050]|uniref:alpha-amylase family glycosyl hydrolase n=1 Tax=Planococcus sp. NCCP-2050 TaxID=2944679 RepID=UPI00203FB46D|nr:alpha-amylase family glycosyl hydrolase [Planococcus sp. NCCP-2050]GKW45113.1 hypothetical protein NCCP2050_08050 [Planococcus sp. NCCP-2050]